MPTPFESAVLNLRLYDLRREPVLREARAWFLRDFNPESFAELLAIAGGERNASFRMVLGYWEHGGLARNHRCDRCAGILRRARRGLRYVQQSSSIPRRAAGSQSRAGLL